MTPDAPDVAEMVLVSRDFLNRVWAYVTTQHPDQYQMHRGLIAGELIQIADRLRRERQP